MRERPIIFSGEMVRAILDGRKTQTRRVVKPLPSSMLDLPTGRQWPLRITKAWPDIEYTIACPYGHHGDRLWVRETWAPMDALLFSSEQSPPQSIAYRADRSAVIFGGDLVPRTADTRNLNWERVRWRPSIHMPRWASRITLEVTDVRVERVQDISSADARAEGVERGATCTDDNEWFYVAGKQHRIAKLAFAALWDSINGAGAWSANPWVWVVEFRRLP